MLSNLIIVDPPAALKMKPTNQVLHLMGDSTQVRHDSFKIGFMDICHSINSNTKRSVKQQLGTDQPSLLAIVLKNYRSDIDLLVSKFKKQLESNYNNFDNVLQLNSAIRRYCEGLGYIEEHWSSKDIERFKQGKWSLLEDYLLQIESPLIQLYSDSNTKMNSLNDIKAIDKKNRMGILGIHDGNTTTLRKFSFQLFLENLKASEKYSHVIDKDERSKLIYVVLEAASMISKTFALSIMNEMRQEKNRSENYKKVSLKSRKKQLLELTEKMTEMFIYADELKDLVVPSKRAFVHHIRTDIYTDLHILYKLQNNPKFAMQYLNNAVDEKEAEAKLTGEQCLPKILAMKGDYLCQQSKCPESLEFFNRAIEITRSHMGSTHITLGRYKSLSGQAHAAAGFYEKAIEDLQTSLSIYALYPESEIQDHKQEIEHSKSIIQLCQQKLQQKLGTTSASNTKTNPTTATASASNTKTNPTTATATASSTKKSKKNKKSQKKNNKNGIRHDEM